MAARGGSLALGIAAIGLLLIGLEGFSRLVFDPPRYHLQDLELHPVLGFRGIPHHQAMREGGDGAFEFRLEANGFRSPEIPAPGAARPSGVMRVALLGDSFLVGENVRNDDLVSERVSARLAGLGIDSEVYNLGVIDYGTQQELLLLRHLGKQIDPDVVVLFLYPHNDVVNNGLALAGRTTVSPGDYLRPYPKPGDGARGSVYTHPSRAWLRRHSRLFATLEWRVLALGVGRKIAWLEPWPVPPSEANQLRAGRAPREEFEIFRTHDAADPWEQAWEATFALLRRIRDASAELDARFLTVVIPAVYQVERTAPGIWLDVVTRSITRQPLDALLDWNLPERRLREFFLAEGIGHLFLLEPLRTSAASGDRVYGRDAHLTPLGNDLAARSVTDWLARGSGEASPQASFSAPVLGVPDPSAAPEQLEFRTDGHPEYFGAGWISWTSEARALERGRGWGWLAGARCRFVVPDRGASLRLLGRVPESVLVPFVGEVVIAGGERRRFRIERSGQFVIDVPLNRGHRRADQSAYGYRAALLVTPSSGNLLLQEIQLTPTGP